MGNRLSKITTRTGDKGSTGLADGSRLPKDHARIVALGDVDELNSHLGVLLAEPLAADIREVLLQIQNDLFDLGGTLALPGHALFPPDRVIWLEEQITHYNASLPPLREFILPGARARAHSATWRAARRAEPNAAWSRCTHQAPDAISPDTLPYLNRLSDLLFVLSRCINRAQTMPENLWKRD